MAKLENYPIDCEKLKKELTRRGLTLAEASREIGRASSYLNHHTNEGYTNKSTIMILEKMFNLSYDAYKLEVPEQKPEQLETPEDQLKGQMTFQLPTMTKDEFWKVIYTATYEAMKKAINEEKEK